MTRKISASTARTEFRQTLAPPPDWLEKSWDSAKRQGWDKLTTKEIDVEIAATRRYRRKQKPGL